MDESNSSNTADSLLEPLDEERAKLIHQIQVDVVRCASVQRQVGLGDRLERLLLQLLERQPLLYYYQGLHTVAGALLIREVQENKNIEDDQILELLEMIAIGRLQDFMHESMHPSIAYLQSLMWMLYQRDPELYFLLMTNESSDPNAKTHFLPLFALSWIMTWFLHDVEEEDDLHRLLLNLLLNRYADEKTGEKVDIVAGLPIYWSARIIMSQKRALFKIYERLKQEPSELDNLYSEVHRLFATMNLKDKLLDTLGDAISDSKIYPMSTMISEYMSDSSKSADSEERNRWRFVLILQYSSCLYGVQDSEARKRRLQEMNDTVDRVLKSDALTLHDPNMLKEMMYQTTLHSRLNRKQIVHYVMVLLMLWLSLQ